MRSGFGTTTDRDRAPRSVLKGIIRPAAGMTIKGRCASSRMVFDAGCRFGICLRHFYRSGAFRRRDHEAADARGVRLQVAVVAPPNRLPHVIDQSGIVRPIV